MNILAQRPCRIVHTGIDFGNSAIGQPTVGSARGGLLAGVGRAALALDPAATLARWVPAFARAARAFFRSWLRSAASRRSVVMCARKLAGRRRLAAGALGALAFFGLAWTVTPAAAVIASYTTTGDVTVDATGEGTTTIGNTGTGSLDVTGTLTSGALDVGAASTGNGAVTVDLGATLNDDAVIGDAGGGGATIYGAHNVSGNLILGNQSTGNGSYTVDGSGAQLTISFAPGGNGGSSYPVNGTNPNANGALIIGNNGVGSFTQSLTAVGSNSTPSVSVAGDVVLGYQGLGNGASSDSAGAYTLNDGVLTIGGKLVVGGGSTGTNGANTFTQNGGSVLLTGSANGNTDYVGVGNSLGAGAIFVGGAGSGIGGGTGTYNLNGGTLTSNTVNLGNDNGGGDGTFNQSGASSVTTNNLIVGNAVGGTGAYAITGDGSQLNVNFAGTPGDAAPMSPNGALIVGNNGTGTFTQGTPGGIGDTAGPSVSVAGDLSVGMQSGSQGTYTINDGTLTVGGGILIGQASTANNQFIQNGGSVIITGSAGGDSRYTPLNFWAPSWSNPGQLVIGGEEPSDNGTGTYTMYDGPAGAPSTLTANFISIGYSGTGTFNQVGGSVTTNGIDMGDCGGCNGSSAAGFYNLTGNGQLTVNGGVSVGDFGYGYFTQNGAATTNTINGTLSIGNGAVPTPQYPTDPSIPFYNRSGTYELDAGTLSTQYTVVGSQGLGTFIQTGGAHIVQDTLTVGQQNLQPLSGPEGSGTYDSPVFGGPAPGYYYMSGGTLTAGGDPSPGHDTSGAGIIVGDAGDGTFNQTGGSVTSGVVGANRGDLIVSAQTGSTGVYNLGVTGQSESNAPTLQVYGDTTIGRDAAGLITFQIPNPAYTQGSNLPMTLTETIPGAASNGTLNIAGNGTSVSINQYTGFNSHNGGNLVVGLNGTGAVTQTDQSTVYLDHNLVLGANQGATGSYTLTATPVSTSPSPGDWSTYNLTVGSDLDIGGMQTDAYGNNFQTAQNGGTGAFNASSGDAYVVGAVNVGNNGGTGNLNVSGTATLTVQTGMNVGDNNASGSGAATGTVTQIGGTVTVGLGTSTANLNVGVTNDPGDGTAGSYSITGSSSVLNVNGNADLGVSPGATGTLTIGAGSDSPIVNINSTPGNSDGNLTIGDGGTGYLYLNSGSLNVANATQIGVNGTGTVTQTGGSFTTGYLDLSVPVGSGSSSYSISSAGTLTTTNDLNVGGTGAGPAAFTQSGGSVDVGGTLRVGNVNGNALYTLTSGTLTTGASGGSSIGDVVIGLGGAGELDNSGGVQQSQSIDGFTLGWDSAGAYKLTGTGSLSVAANENIGVFGAGTFLQGDGKGLTSNTVGGSLYISSGYGGPATAYTLTDGSLTVAGSEIVGFAAQGSFNQSGGANNANGGLTIGLMSPNPGYPTQFGAGTYTLGGSGALNVGGDLVIGSGAGSTGVFDYNVAAGDAGRLAFTGSRQNLVIGGAGAGAFNQGGGDLNLYGEGVTLTIGSQAGSNGAYTMTGGTLEAANVYVGNAGMGRLSVDDGTATVYAPSQWEAKVC